MSKENQPVYTLENAPKPAELFVGQNDLDKSLTKKTWRGGSSLTKVGTQVIENNWQILQRDIDPSATQEERNNRVALEIDRFITEKDEDPEFASLMQKRFEQKAEQARRQERWNRVVEAVASQFDTPAKRYRALGTAAAAALLWFGAERINSPVTEPSPTPTPALRDPNNNSVARASHEPSHESAQTPIPTQQPTVEPTREPTKTPEPTQEPEKPFTFGAIDMTQPFEIIVPKELAEMAGYEDVLYHSVNPYPQTGERVDPKTISVFENYHEFPNAIVIEKADIDDEKKNAYVVQGHSLSATTLFGKQELVFEWLRRLVMYNSPQAIVGKRLFFKQTINGTEVIQHIDIIDSRVVEPDIYNSSLKNFGADAEPYFFDTSRVSMPDEVRNRDKRLTLVTCIGGKNANGDYDRTFITIAPVN